MPKYSFIIPVYKTEKYLKECVDSILVQTYQDYEIILVDDGSPDCCGKICDAYAGNSEKVQTIHIPNSGLSVARNTGLEASDGTYIVFLDSDDYWYSAEDLSKIDSVLSPDVDILIFPSYDLYGNGSDLRADRYSYPSVLNSLGPEECLEYMITHDLFNLHAGKRVFRKGFLTENDLRFQPDTRAEDVELGFRVANALPNYRFLNRRIYVYRHREGSITTTINAQNLYEVAEIVKTYAEFTYANDHIRSLLLSYDAYQLSLLLAHLYKADKSDQRKLLEEMENYQYLYNYRSYPRTKTIALMHRLIGFRMTQKVLSAYLKSR